MRPIERDKRARALHLLSEQDHHNCNVLSKSTAHIKTHERAYRAKLKAKRDAEEAFRLANEAYEAQKTVFRDAFNANMTLKTTVARNQELIKKRKGDIESAPAGVETGGIFDPLDLEDIEAPEPAIGYQVDQEPGVQRPENQEAAENQNVRSPSNNPTQRRDKGKGRARPDPPDAVPQQPERGNEPDPGYEASSESEEEPLATVLARRNASRQQGMLPSTRPTQQFNPPQNDVEPEVAPQDDQRPAKKPRRPRRKKERLQLSMETKKSKSGKDHHLFRIHAKTDQGIYARKDAVSSRLRKPRQRIGDQEEDDNDIQDGDDGVVVLSDREEERIYESDQEWLRRQRSESIASHISVRTRQPVGAAQPPRDRITISPDTLPNDEPYEEPGQDAPPAFPLLMGATNWSNQEPQRQDSGPGLTEDQMAMHDAMSEGGEETMLPYDPNHGSDWETVSSKGTCLFVSERLLMRPRRARNDRQTPQAEYENGNPVEGDEFLEHLEDGRFDIPNNQLPRDYGTPEIKYEDDGDGLLFSDSVSQRFRSASMGAHDQGNENVAQLPASSVDAYGRERSLARSDTGQTGVGLFVTGRTPDPVRQPEAYERLMKRRRL